MNKTKEETFFLITKLQLRLKLITINKMEPTEYLSSFRIHLLESLTATGEAPKPPLWNRVSLRFPMRRSHSGSRCPDFLLHLLHVTLSVLNSTWSLCRRHCDWSFHSFRKESNETLAIGRILASYFIYLFVYSATQVTLPQPWWRIICTRSFPQCHACKAEISPEQKVYLLSFLS